MADRIPSDHPSIETVRASIARHGGTDRPRIEIPAEHTDAFPSDEVLRFSIDGDERFARIERPFGGDGVHVTGAYDAPQLARDREGENRLTEWVRSGDVRIGGSALIDVIEPGFAYGLRAPGERAVYDAVEAPSDSLASIARKVESDARTTNGEET